ncbi:MAG: hypothetical protein Q4F41_08430 [Eubacteriales bacterium]|nr:hypothetical protein [Eubacteriales bacterium]
MSNLIRDTFEAGNGIFRMIPNFIPIKFGKPGRRLKLHPDDYFKLGADSGTIMERWICAMKGARAKNPKIPDLGYSYVLAENGEKFLLCDAVKELKETLIGEELQKTYGAFPVYAKFFDYETPLYFHFHPRTEIAGKVGCEAKPECYYFPPQLNPHGGERPSTYFGFHAGVTKEEVRDCIAHFADYDTHVTSLSQAFDLEVGTGWYVPAGVLHAPGSLLTYEPQWCTDLNCVLENVVCGEVFGERYLTDIVPEGEENPADYILNALDWEANFEPDFKEKYFRKPVELPKTQEGLTEKWVCYGNEYIASKEVTIQPGKEILLKDHAAYGCICVQGFGSFGTFHAEAVNMMRVGDQTCDEFFVGKARAQEGVRIRNDSAVEPMVFLQHFGPDNTFYTEQEK